MIVRTEHGSIKKLSAERARQIINEMSRPDDLPRRISKPVTQAELTIPTIKLPEFEYTKVDKPQVPFTGNGVPQKKESPVFRRSLIEDAAVDDKPDLDSIREYLRNEETVTLPNKEPNLVNLRKYGIYYLYYMSYFKAAPSIMTWGIFCRRLAVKFKVIMHDFSDQDVQARRKMVHSFVPLYFTTYNAMKYRWLHGSADGTPSCMQPDELVFFEINASKAFSVTGVQFSDMNAAKTDVHFFNDPSDLDKLGMRLLNSSDDIEKHANRQAEVLVPKHLPPGLIQRVIVNSNERKVWLEKEYALELERLNQPNNLTKKIPTTVSTKYF